MHDLVLWTWVMGGTPLVLALIWRALEWSFDTICAGTIGRRSAARERPASDTGLWWTHA